MDIKYELKIEPEYLSLREAFPELIDEELFELARRLDRGDLWALCNVVMEATIELDGQTFKGTRSCGCCSYDNEKDFIQNSGMHEQLQIEAKEDLKSSLARIVKSAKTAQKALDLL